MKKIILSAVHRFILSIFLCALTVASANASEAKKKTATLSNAQQVKDCNFTPPSSWWTQPYSSLPSSVAKNPVTGSPEFCEFYQFAQDWFLYLVSPAASGGVANWQDQTQYPILLTSGNSCSGVTQDRGLTIRTAKSVDDSSPPVLPERTDQAGAHAIYDQKGNVVFYEVMFSKNLCDYSAIQANPNFPGKTVELKMGWRVMNPGDDTSTFVTSKATIDGKPYKLGLIGWHIVVTADNHPEMVWATQDHKNNAINCADFSSTASAYDFTSQSCARDESNCKNLNQTQPFTTVTLPNGEAGNDICQEFPYGTVEGDSIDTRNGLNIALIKKLNDAQASIFKQTGLPSSLPVWENYQFTGALWVSDISKPSGSQTGDTNQRGSLELANVVLETSFQGTAGTAGSATNCFGCHHYNGSVSSNTAFAARLSHIFDDIILGQCKDFASSTVINSQSQAEATCPGVCAPNPGFTKWNGQWTNEGVPMTVCGCCPDSVK